MNLLKQVHKRQSPCFDRRSIRWTDWLDGSYAASATRVGCQNEYGWDSD